jgi:hypothetical protein
MTLFGGMATKLRSPPPNFETSTMTTTFDQWEFQDPKTEVLYHIRPYFMEIFPEI